MVAKEPTFTGGNPLYRLHELLNADAGQAVYICEGEQKADYLASLGLIATTSGKSSANATDWQPLAGRKVIVWHDFDDAGQSYQADVTSVLSGLGGELWAVQADGDLLVFEYPKNQPPPPDLIDLLRNHKAELLAYLASQPKHPTHHTGAYVVLTANQSRALAGFNVLLARRQQTLINGGYKSSQALVRVEDWHRVVMQRLELSRDQMRDLERSLLVWDF